jgi:uncharacterized protein YkwD
MSLKTMACLAALGPMFLIGCAGSPGESAGAAPEAANVVATNTEQTLLSSLNAERRKAGKSELKISSKLTGLARGESDAAAAAGKIPGDTTASLVARSGYGTVGKLQGALKDRGPQTGAGFIEYWAKGEAETVLDDWSNVGVGVSKSADGRLFAVVVLGSLGSGGGGTSLMRPAMSPGGF